MVNRSLVKTQISAAIRIASRAICVGGELGVAQQRARRGEGEVAAGADREQSVLVRLEQVAVAGDQEASLAVGDDHQRLELAQGAIGAPVLGQLDDRALEVARELLELGLEAGEQRQRVGAAAGEADQHLSLAGALHLGRAGLDHGVVHRHLTVGGHAEAAVAAHQEDGGGVGFEARRAHEHVILRRRPPGPGRTQPPEVSSSFRRRARGWASR